MLVEHSCGARNMDDSESERGNLNILILILHL